jgi:hypothetical protein
MHPAGRHVKQAFAQEELFSDLPFNGRCSYEYWALVLLSPLEAGISATNVGAMNASNDLTGRFS